MLVAYGDETTVNVIVAEPQYARRHREKTTMNVIVTASQTNVVLAPTVNSFKSRLDSFWKDLPSKFDPACQH